MFHEPRNWKWMVPAALVAPCIVWWNKWVMLGGMWNDLAVLPLMIAIILSIAALVNLWLYVDSHRASIYADFQAARNSTPEVRMFEAARGMHPEAVQALLIHRRAIWRIKYVPIRDVADWILDEAPTVHAGFVDFVLDHSSSVSIMPKHLLSEGSKQFDPEGLILDYQQYDDTLLLLQQKLMCTQALGNQSAHWLPPWNPELIRHRFGLDGDQYVVEEMSDAMKAITRAQARTPLPSASLQIREASNLGGNGNGASSAATNTPPLSANSIIDQALDGLEQTQEMKARARNLISS